MEGGNPVAIILIPPIILVLLGTLGAAMASGMRKDAIKDVDDAFLRKRLELAIDGTDPEDLREILESEIEAKRKADKVGAKPRCTPRSPGCWRSS